MQVVQAGLAQLQQLPEVCWCEGPQVLCHEVAIGHLWQQLLQLRHTAGDELQGKQHDTSVGVQNVGVGFVQVDHWRNNNSCCRPLSTNAALAVEASQQLTMCCTSSPNMSRQLISRRCRRKLWQRAAASSACSLPSGKPERKHPSWLALRVSCFVHCPSAVQK